MAEVYKEYQDGTAEVRAALEQKYGKIFNRLMDDMASMETIRATAKQCPKCSIYVDVRFDRSSDAEMIPLIFSRNWTGAIR